MTARSLLLVTALTLTGACGETDKADRKPIQATPTVASSPTFVAPTTTDRQSRPVGLIALGHSGLTGAYSDPAFPHNDAWHNSWATGTAPSINSISQRMTAIRPETAAHVRNAAVDGSPAAALTDQAVQALETVAQPALAIIMTVDNDIRCDGTDANHIVEFGHSITDAIETILARSPATHILLLGQLGRPTTFAAAISHNSEAARTHAGDGPCDLFDTQLNIDRDNIVTITALVEMYETELDNVCAPFPQCHRDAGALAAFSDDIDDLVEGDWNHLTANGHSRLAATIWPIVETILNAE
jgi:hypothetical protein